MDHLPPSDVIAAIVVLVIGAPVFIWLLRVIARSVKLQRKCVDSAQEGMELHKASMETAREMLEVSRANLELQREANDLMRQLIAALRAPR